MVTPYASLPNEVIGFKNLNGSYFQASQSYHLAPNFWNWMFVVTLGLVLGVMPQLSLVINIGIC